MQKDAGVVAAADRFERVEWVYDGMGGKVLTWTKENGNTHEDPSVLAFVVGPDGKATASCPERDVHDAGSFARWLRERAAEFEKAHPRSKIPFVPAEIELVGEGEGKRAHCHALGVAREMKTPVAVYVGREEREGDDAKARAEAAAARKFEKETLGSAEAAKAAEGWTLLRVDRSTEEGALLAKSLGVGAAPAVVLLPAGAEKGIVLDGKTSAGSLAYQWKKASAPPPPPAPPPAK